MKKTLLNTFVVFLSVTIGLVLCELVLVMMDWAPQKTTSEYMQFGYSTGVPVWDEDGLLEEAKPVKVKLFQYDDELFWSTIPGTEFTNEQGFRGAKDVSVANHDGAIRIMILGDSCSFLGRKLYADFLYEKLTEDNPGIKFEIINASVPGYTSFQGKNALSQLVQYKPHYVCIYFGWNDHWILPSGYSDQFHYDLIHSLKFMQLAKIMFARLTDMRDYRVPIESYQQNLLSMAAELKENGAIPVMIAAPAGYSAKGMPRWAFEFYRQYYRMTQKEITEIPQTHKAYAAVVEEVAKENDLILVDAQQHFRQLSESMRPFFRSDLIHLTGRGHQALADEIYRQMQLYNVKKNLSWARVSESKPGQ